MAAAIPYEVMAGGSFEVLLAAQAGQTERRT